MLISDRFTPSGVGHQVSAAFIAFRVAQVIAMVELLRIAVLLQRF
jgi:hypothetical protein